MKYDQQLSELKNLLPTAKNILIALPVGVDIDKLASAMSLLLAFTQQGKQVSVVCDDDITVSQSYLIGVDHIQKNMPQGAAGNFVLTLEGVPSENGRIPSLEKMDYRAENNNLNLIFYVIPGQTFQPTRIVPKYQGSKFDLIFVIGAANLDSLGAVYKANADSFSGVHLVNIDNQNNSQFGQTNIVDTNASSVSEVTAQVLTDLGINIDPDAATNLLAGIFAATANLTADKVNADTFSVVASLLRAGGKKPNQAQLSQSPTQPGLSALLPNQPASQATIPALEPDQYTTPPVVSSAAPTGANQPSPEERPVEEGVVSETVEPEWLTPKIFKGTSIG